MTRRDLVLFKNFLRTLVAANWSSINAGLNPRADLFERPFVCRSHFQIRIHLYLGDGVMMLTVLGQFCLMQRPPIGRNKLYTDL